MATTESFYCNHCNILNSLHPTNTCNMPVQLMPSNFTLEDALEAIQGAGACDKTEALIKKIIDMTEPELQINHDYEGFFILDGAYQKGFETFDNNAHLLVVHANDLIKFVKEQRGVPMTPTSPQTVAQILDEAHNKITALILASNPAPPTEKPPFTKFQKDALYKVSKYLALRKEMGRPNGFIHGWYLEDRQQNVNLMEADLQILVDALKERI